MRGMKSSVPFLLLTVLTPSASPLTFPDVIVLAAQKQLQRRRMPMTTGGSATENWTSDLGISTLHNVQLLASKVARASDTADAEVVDQSKPSTSQPGERVQLALKSLEQDSEFMSNAQNPNRSICLVSITHPLTHSSRSSSRSRLCSAQSGTFG